MGAPEPIPFGISTSPSKPAGGLIPGRGPWPRVLAVLFAVLSAAVAGYALGRARVQPPVKLAG